MSTLSDKATELSNYTQKNAEMLYRYSELIKQANDEGNEQLKMFAWNEFKHIVEPYQRLMREMKALERDYLAHKKRLEDKIPKKHDLPDWMVKSDPHAVAEGFYDFDHKPPFTSPGVPYEINQPSQENHKDPVENPIPLAPEGVSSTQEELPSPDPVTDPPDPE